MDDKFLSNLDTIRAAAEQATSTTGMWKLAIEEAQRSKGAFDFESVFSTLAEKEYVFRDYERLSANSALIGEAMANAVARSSALTELSSRIDTNLLVSPLVAFDVKVPELPVRAAWIEKFARLNESVTGAIASIPFDHLSHLDKGLSRRLVGLSDSYRDIFAHLPEINHALPGFVADLPARDIIVKSAMVSSRATDFEPSEALVDLDDPAYSRSDVDLMLADLNPNYVVMLDEVFEVFHGRTIGRVRHVLISLRELITHVLHDLSPENELRAWSTNPKYFHQDRPTRAARYLYICRFVNCGPYGKYVQKSSGMTSAFFEALNGLHQVRPDIGEFQLRLMVTDALSILRFLLRTAKHRT